MEPVTALPTDDGPLVLGPLLRHVSGSTATVWVSTRDAATVAVTCGDRRASAATFAVEGHHYALVVLDGLAPGSRTPYRVSVDGVEVWPLPPDTPPGTTPPGTALPPSVIETLEPDRDIRIAFGSCRVSVPHDAENTRRHGVDALRAFAIDLARDPDRDDRPDVLALLGDQVYADDTSQAMQEFIRHRRNEEQGPGTELKDFVEYAHLYRLAWSDPWNRWLLSTLPSSMIFDDHDVRDDWNTSAQWHAEMNATDWWHERMIGAMSSYWVYQHMGNLAPDELERDEIWQLVLAHRRSGATGELDLTADLRAFAARVDAHPDTYRWSHTRALGRARLIVVDSRAARDLRPGHRSMLDAKEMAWLDRQLQGGDEHLFIGTSLPFLMPPGLHAVEALDEVMADGHWGGPAARIGEKLRQGADLEHWAAFGASFAAVLEMVVELARGERGPAPRTMTFLSGDVHNSYITELDGAHSGLVSRVTQAVCSPIRNPLAAPMKLVTRMLSHGLAAPVQWLARRSTHVPHVPYRWSVTHGPWFDNNLAMVAVAPERLHFTWDAGDVTGDDHDHPGLRRVADIVIDVPAAPVGNRGGTAR